MNCLLFNNIRLSYVALQSGPSAEEIERKQAMELASQSFVAAKEIKPQTPEAAVEPPPKKEIDWDAVG